MMGITFNKHYLGAFIAVIWIILLNLTTTASSRLLPDSGDTSESLSASEGVFVEHLDWELTGENPIPGHETSVSIDIDVTFREVTRDLEGDNLWRVTLFGSTNILGEGPRFGEVAQILSDEQSSRDISGSNPLKIDGIQTDFEYGTIGCVEDVSYICLEFLKGDDPNPDFAFHGDSTSDKMMLCKLQGCQFRVVFTELEATLLSSEIIVQNTDYTETTVKLKATTDKLLSTSVSGEQLWQVKTFFSKNNYGRGTRVNEQPQILTASQDHRKLKTGKNLAFSEIDFQVDLSGVTCAEIPYMCFELMKNPSSSIDYTFETQPEQDPFVDCISMDDVCKELSPGGQMNDSKPCVFGAETKLHGDEWKVDECMTCTCTDGSLSCDVKTCQTPNCVYPVMIPGECCVRCPYKMQFYTLLNNLPPGSRIREGKPKKMKFSAYIEVVKGKTSREIRGDNMWRMSAWVSKHSDGSGQKFSYNPNIFTEKQRAQAFLRKNYNPPNARWAFNKLRYVFDSSEGTCKNFRYFCIKFNMTDYPRPTFELDFTYSVYREQYQRETACVRLGPCKGVFAESFNWELTGDNPVPGQVAPVSFDIEVMFHHDSRDLEGDNLWRVALFGSSNPLGEGPRFGEVAQILNDEQSSRDISGANPLQIDDIQTDFEYGTIGCVEDVNYICMEFLKGDAPNPDFTFRGAVVQDKMMLCKQQECQLSMQ